MVVTIADVEARMGRTLGADELPRAEAAIADATALVLDEGDARWGGETPPPAVVVAIVCQIVRRVLDNPDGVVSETVGTESYRLAGHASSGVYLTREEKRLVRRAAGRFPFGSLRMVNGAQFPGTDGIPEWHPSGLARIRQGAPLDANGAPPPSEG